MRKLFVLLFAICSLVSCRSQESLILEKIKINWEDYPNIFEDYSALKYKHNFQFLENVNMHEITYLSNDLKIQSFIATPKKKGKYPVIIFNRGGNRDFGSLSLFRERYKYPVAYHFSKLANEGYVVIGCNYRGSGKSEGKDEFGGKDVNDVLNLFEIIREIPEADNTKIGMYGWSRGGMMTYLTLLRTNQIKAIVVGGGISDLTVIDRPEMETNVYSELIPNYWKNKETELKKRSALFWVDKFPKHTPVLM